jgi:hypothetical protein
MTTEVAIIVAGPSSWHRNRRSAPAAVQPKAGAA